MDILLPIAGVIIFLLAALTIWGVVSDKAITKSSPSSGGHGDTPRPGDDTIQQP